MVRSETLRWEGFFSGLAVGIGVTLLSVMAFNEVAGMRRVGLFRRAVETQNLERIASAMDEELRVAEAAIEDERPLPVSDWLASDLLLKLYRHHARYAVDLLRRGNRDRFNELRQQQPWLVYDLGGADLSGRDLTTVDLHSAGLAAAKLGGCDLSHANFAGADLAGADLTAAQLDGTSFYQANLSGARLNRIWGTGPDFREAVLVGASMTEVTGLEAARFEHAVLSEANLWRSAFPAASFDHADLTMGSAVGADLSRIASMDGATLNGCVLDEADLAPKRMPRSWMTGSQGVSPRQRESLRRAGAVFMDDDVLQLVDPRIVAGFRAQIEANPEIPIGQRHRTLISMLHDYYQQ